MASREVKIGYQGNTELRFDDFKRNYYEREKKYKESLDHQDNGVLSRETMQSDYVSTDNGEMEQMETLKENETPLNIHIHQNFGRTQEQKSFYEDDNTSSLSMQMTNKINHVPQRVTVSTLKRNLTNLHSKSNSRDRSKKRQRSVSKGRRQLEKKKQTSELFVWGLDMSGQLGLRAQKQYYTKPKMSTWNIGVRQIACGRDHTAILTEQGQVYTLGSNQNGKLG